MYSMLIFCPQKSVRKSSLCLPFKRFKTVCLKAQEIFVKAQLSSISGQSSLSLVRRIKCTPVLVLRKQVLFEITPIQSWALQVLCYSTFLRFSKTGPLLTIQYIFVKFNSQNSSSLAARAAKILFLKITEALKINIQYLPIQGNSQNCLRPCAK